MGIVFNIIPQNDNELMYIREPFNKCKSNRKFLPHTDIFIKELTKCTK